MPTTPVSPAQAITVLNELLVLDRTAICALIERRVRCNEALTDHPTCQVAPLGADGYSVGLLGVLNAIFGSNEESWGALCAVFDDDGALSKFALLSRSDGNRVSD